jgi:hypothetical protein
MTVTNETDPQKGDRTVWSMPSTRAECCSFVNKQCVCDALFHFEPSDYNLIEKYALFITLVSGMLHAYCSVHADVSLRELVAWPRILITGRLPEFSPGSGVWS